MKRILIISQHFPPDNSGNASRIFDMAYYLTKLGHNTYVLSPPPSFPTGQFMRCWNIRSCFLIDGIHLTNLWTWQPKTKDPSFISRIGYYLIFPLHASLWIFFNYSKFDLIITSSPPLFTHIPGLLAKRIFRKEWMIDIRDLWIDASITLGFLKKGSLLESISRYFERKCLHNADLIGVTTTELGRRITKEDSVKGKIQLIPNGVDLHNFSSVSVPKKQQIIYTGNVGHAQDLETVIYAMRIVSEIIPLTFLIVGDGDILSLLYKQVNQENLENVVIFKKPQPRHLIPQMLRESLIGLAPLKNLESLEYAAPTKVYEYMASEIPFIGCGKGEIVTIAHESGAGIIATNTSESIANTIISLVNNPELMEEMGKRGRQYITGQYDRESIATKLHNFIERIS